MARKMKSLLWRIKILITRKVTWVDRDTGRSITVKESWPLIWAMVGVHSYKWWWVNRYGKLPCGCIHNPITRRMVIYRGNCPTHGLRREPRETDRS